MKRWQEQPLDSGKKKHLSVESSVTFVLHRKIRDSPSRPLSYGSGVRRGWAQWRNPRGLALSKWRQAIQFGVRKRIKGLWMD